MGITGQAGVPGGIPDPPFRNDLFAPSPNETAHNQAFESDKLRTSDTRIGDQPVEGNGVMPLGTLPDIPDQPPHGSRTPSAGEPFGTGLT